MSHHQEPEELHEKTPQWFKDWYNKSFWHFQTRVENKLSLHSKLIWIVLAAILASIVARYVIG